LNAGGGRRKGRGEEEEILRSEIRRYLSATQKDKRAGRMNKRLYFR